MKIKSKKLTSLLALTPLAGLFLLIFYGQYFVGLVGFNYIYSQGERVGQVVKVSNKGLIWKTWEAGMGITQSGAYIESWEFSVDQENPNKEQIIEKLTKAYNHGELVKIRYNQRLGALPWRGKTSYFIEDVKFLNLFPNRSSGEEKPQSSPLPGNR